MTINYTPDRYTALHMASCNEVCCIDGMIRRRDGEPLKPGILASLVAMTAEGYVQQDVPDAGTDDPAHRPIRPNMPGIQLLAAFRFEHSRHQVTEQPS